MLLLIKTVRLLRKLLPFMTLVDIPEIADRSAFESRC